MHKTALRVAEKRKEICEDKERESLQYKIQTTHFRMKWREGVKRNTHQKVDAAVDKIILEDTITNNPQIVLNLKLDELYTDRNVFEASLAQLIMDITADNYRSHSKKKIKFLYHSESSEDESDSVKSDEHDATFASPFARVLLRNQSHRVSSVHASKRKGDSPDQRQRHNIPPNIRKLICQHEPREDDCKVKTVGLMSKIIERKEPPGRIHVSAQSIVPERVGVSTNASKQSPIATPLAGETHSNPTPPQTHAGKNQVLASLAECVFLIGPAKAAIDECVRNELAPYLGTDSSTLNGHADGGANASPKASVTLPSFEIEVKVLPNILFMTECSNPGEMLSLLPTYCYPRRVRALD